MTLFNSGEWMSSIRNSFFIATSATIISTALGTIAAVGLSRRHMPARGFITAILISPMVVPLIVTGAGLFSFYARLNLTSTFFSIIMSHVVLGTPFVIITVTAAMSGFDQSLIRAAQNLGAEPGDDLFQGHPAAAPAGRDLRARCSPS